MTKLNALLKNLTTDDIETAKDTLGGFKLLDSGVYAAKVKMAYITQSAGGATGVALELFIAGPDQTHMETLWVTSKEGVNFYKTKEGQKKPLPGFTVANDLCMLVTEQPLSMQETEEKKVEVYDFETKGRVLKSLPVLVDLIGGLIQVGIFKQIVNKRAKNDAGFYVTTSDTKEENVINKIFHAQSYQTLNEVLAKSEARFEEQWKDRYAGITLDKTVPVVEYAKPTPASPSSHIAKQAAPKAKKNIFQD